MTQAIGALVLAAGFSTRFGSSKLLATLANGNTVFGQTIARINEAVANPVVVTRPEMVSTLQPLAPQALIKPFEHAERGMGATLAYAIQQIDDWDGCVVCLADMPFIEAASYAAIANALSVDSIVVPCWETKPGNPVAFGSRHFRELSALDGDSGGRKLLDAHPEAVLSLPLNDPGILQDIDTQAELARLQDS